MKKYYSFVLFAITALSFFTVNAQDSKNFPEWKESSPNQQVAKVTAKVSPNLDKTKGIPMYATTLTDYFTERGWWTFKSADTYNATKIKTWTPGSGSYVDGLGCGSWGGDAYYAYYVMQYDLGTDYADSFVKIDVATGDTTVVAKFPKGHEFRDNWHDYILYCMTYNPVDKVIYALGQTALEDRAVTSLYKIDKETGIPTKIKDFDFISFAFAVDMNGKLWVEVPISNDAEDKIIGCKFHCMETENFTVEKELTITISGKPFKTFYYGTMSFDYTNGNLYWIASDEYYKQAMYKVNTETGEMEKLGSFWGGTFNGLYIPYTLPDTPDAPAAVAELTAKAGATGALNSTLTWINPTLQWNKEVLTKLSEILIYRKGVEEPVATLNTTADQIGKEMEWSDENATQGINAYYVVPCSEKGVKGTKDSIKVYVGEDAPGAVSNIQMALDGESIVVTWDAPTIGQNEGYIDPSKTKYTITRLPDSLQLKKDFTERTFTDNNLNEIQYYYYIIQTTNNIGTGDSAQSEDGILAGQTYTVPVELKFSNYSDSEIWTNLGRWYWSSGTRTGDERMMVGVESERDNWLISPSIKLEAGKRYRIISTIKTDYGPNHCLYNFTFTVGKGKTGADQTTVLRKVTDYTATQYNFVDTFEDYVDITESGTYNYGINVTKIIGDDEFSFMGVSIEEVYDTDMAAVEINNLFEAIYNKDNICNVTVKNNGKNTLSDYKVQIARATADGYTVLGETTKVQTIEPNNTAVIPVTFRPDKEEDMDIIGIVVAEGDGDSANDKTGIYSITVLPEGTMEFNKFITGDGKGTNTRIPLSFVSDESTVQSLYLSNEIDVQKDCKIQRMAYEYTDNEINSVLGPINIKVYMGNADKQEYVSVDDMLPLTDLKLVYDGETTINLGFNQMVFNLQEPFEYQKDKNLCITVVKNGLVGKDYPARFNVFNNYEDSPKRTILSEKKSSMQRLVPVLHLAIDEKITGISRDITIGSSFVWYNPSNQTLNFTDTHIREVRIYDISGKVIANYSLSDNTTTLPVNIPLGLYIVRILSMDGTTTNAKLNIMK